MTPYPYLLCDTQQASRRLFEIFKNNAVSVPEWLLNQILNDMVQELTRPNPDTMDFPSDDTMDLLGVFEGAPRRFLQDALQVFASDVMRELRQSGVWMDEPLQGYSHGHLVQGNLLLIPNISNKSGPLHELPL